MIKIFDEALGIEEAGATVSGGLLLTATARADLEQLVGLCVELRTAAPRSYAPFRELHDQPMRALYADLLIGGSRLHAQSIGPTEPWWRPEISSLTSSLRTSFDYLTMALATLFDVWDEDRSDSDPEATAQLFLAVANPATPNPEGLELDFAERRAMLVLQPGSLVPIFALEGVVKGYGWVTAAGAKVARVFGRTAQASGNRLVEGAREQARKTAKHVFPRIDRFEPKELAELRAHEVVVVFLHGLFSTDLGTFDGFIDALYASNPSTLPAQIVGDQAVAGTGGRAGALKELGARLQANIDAFAKAEPGKMQAMEKRLSPADTQAAVKSGVGFVGWPHNTLTSIRTNGNWLADTLENTFLPEPPKILFVCHSRGGLVARAAIASLVGAGRGETWRRAIGGLITFGTPHDGASIAEHSLRDLATYFLLSQSTRRVASLTDVLSYLDARTAEGVEQLKRDEATTEAREQAFTDELYALERTLARDAMGRRLPSAIAIGGKLGDAARATWRGRASSALVTRWLDTPDHDLVVELNSTTSSRLNADITGVMTCDHFTYFDRLSAAPDLANLVAARVWSEIDLTKAFRNFSTGIPVFKKPFSVGPKLKPAPE